MIMMVLLILSMHFPSMLSENRDNDSDGVGDNADLDDDNDGTPDTSDLFPNTDYRYASTKSLILRHPNMCCRH